MATKRMNVLIYSGKGSTADAVRHCIYTLRQLLSPNYAVIPIEGNAVLKEPWTATCALFVMPGGADLGYCRILNGEGNRRITQYVERGGRYLGFCAGAYYGSSRCEFEAGNKSLEVIGDRELAFFPGICRGLAFPGFVYNSEGGARAVELKVHKSALAKGAVPEVFRSYYNGGGVFVDAPKLRDKGVEVLAEYTQPLNVNAGDGMAAVVYRKAESGSVVLSCAHPEFAAVNLDHQSKILGYDKTVQALTEDDAKRTDFVKAILLKLGLDVSQESSTVPSLSRLHLSSSVLSATSDFISSLKDIITTQDGVDYIKGENDTFRLERSSARSFETMAGTLPVEKGTTANAVSTNDDRFLDYDKVTKVLTVHDNERPSNKEASYFNHAAFYASLRQYNGGEENLEGGFGNNLLYGEVVTSTNTMLEKSLPLFKPPLGLADMHRNSELLRRLPTGFTATATVQIAGRGRGSNVWVSPAGSLIFSTVIRHPASVTSHAPVIFLQYLAALAIVQGIQTYDTGYQNLPVKLKWPNDIYALDPTTKAYVKIGGILVNSHYNASDFLCVVGVGINTTNAAPTTSLNALQPPQPFTVERLLARILTAFSEIYRGFVRTGFDRKLEDLYYEHWLHTDQIVTLEAEGGVRARIRGITGDWGQLVAEELGWEDRPTGRKWQLQSDSNSFDFFKGLVKRKL